MTNDNRSDLITVTQAYAAMFEFLMRFNDRYQSNDVAGLLTGLSTLNDGRPMDGLYWDQWIECVAQAKAGLVSTALELDGGAP